MPALLKLLLGAAGLALAALTARRAPRQVAGSLRCDPGRVPAATYRVGQFVVRWEPRGGGRLAIAHADHPERAAWASLPGRSFAAAALGAERVSESRGHFAIADRLRRVWANQTIERIVAEEQALTIAGRLFDSRSARAGAEQGVAYTFRLAAQTPRQLGFTLALADRALNRTFLTYASDRGERFFGFGAQYSYFDMKGRRLPIFVSEQGIGRGAQPITLMANLRAGAGGAWHTSYAGVPHYLSSRLRSLFLTSYEYAVFDMRRADRVQIALFAPELTGRILCGESPAELIAEHTAYAGRMRPLPEWVHQGAIVGVQGGTVRAREILARLDALGTPVAALWLQDWTGARRTSFGWQLWWNWELDQARYAGWDALRAELAARGIRLLTYANPFLTDCSAKPGVRRDLFRESVARGFLTRDRRGRPYLTRITDFSAGLVDLTNPAARAWLTDVIAEQVIGAGASGWMADFGEALPYDAVLRSGEPAARFHNRYPEAWAALNRAAIEASGQGDELVFFMRAGYLRSPRYATLFWLGDQLVSWDARDGIKTAVIGLLSSGMSGFSLNHSDIGGYTTITHPLWSYHRGKELLLRWVELNAFTVVFRSHEGNRPAANAQVYSDDETLAHFDRFARVYRAWGFYRRRLVREAAETGLPVVRHPFIHYPDDPNVLGLSYQQFMVGEELVVAPVLDPGRATARVYLPRGRWVHLWSGAGYGSRERGAWAEIAAPVGRPAVFYRAGSAVGAEFAARLRAEGVL
jgi:alpha-glucosidase